MRKSNIVYQHDSMQCGVACLAMVCRMMGKNYSLSTISKYCRATKAGVSFAEMADGASLIGFKAEGLRLNVAALSQQTSPCILHWNQNHFVVLYKTSGDGKHFYIADPARGYMKYTRKELCKHWMHTYDKTTNATQGLVLRLEPTEAFGCIEEDVDEGISSFAFLFQYIKAYKRYFALIVTGLLIACLLQLALPYLTQAIVDKGIRLRNYNLVWLILMGELFVVIGRTVNDFTRRWILLHISMRINVSLVSSFFIKLLKLRVTRKNVWIV